MTPVLLNTTSIETRSTASTTASTNYVVRYYTRLTALTRELEVAAFIIKELEMEVLIRERKDEALTLMEKLTDIQQRGEQELRELKDLLKHDESSAAVIQALEDLWNARVRP
ncbi:hypothetical protein BGX38DRAFT_1280985 [Terfezia claveryi]|nr:hypothetical protein BGX38DRAFT_1280985 [Terfezia claveryi]